MFAANDPPIIGKRDKEAIMTRIVPIDLPYTFVEVPDGELEKQAKPERELKEELETPEALSGFLNLALDGVERLEDNSGDVSLPESPRERLRKYERAADPMREFGERCLTNDPDSYSVKADVTTMFREFANANDFETGENVHTVLHNVLRGVPGLNYTESRPRSPDYADVDLPLRGWEERKSVVSRVTLTQEGLEYADAAGIVVEEPEDAEETSDTPSVVTPDTIDLDTYDDREILPTLRAKVPHVWKGDYGDPVTELLGDGGACVDLRFQGFDSPSLAPVEGGAEYEFDGLRVRNKPGERPYVEYRPTTSREQVSAPPTSDDSDSGPDTDAPGEAEQTQAATDGGDTAETDGADDGTDEPRSEKQRFAAAFRRAETDDSEFVEYDDLFRELTEFYDEGRAKRLIEKAKTRRKPAWIIAVADRTFQRGDLPK